ncbi:MAG: hypothetical protein U9O86_09900 [Campylobacterota bacterium]|nr:hypothetical protein [Campylobacterota bacterium]
MSRIDLNVQMTLLKEAKMYLEDVKTVGKTGLEKKKEPVVLTQEHIVEWLEVFYEDRVMMDTCNQATVKR